MTKKRIFGKIIGILFCLGCFVLSLIFSLNTYMLQNSRGRIDISQNGKEYDCILILGAGVHADGTPTLMLKDRLDRGIELYNSGVSSKIIMSGDHGSDSYDEVNVMKEYAIDAGVPSEDIFMDHAGFSTYESLYRARDVFCVEKVLIVTQEYHLYRALFLADRMGLEADGASARDVHYYGQSYRHAREILARAKDWVYTVIMPKPAYLGEPIPVWGNGDVTNDY